MNARSASTAPGSGTASGFAESTSSAVVSARSMFTFAPKPSGCSLWTASTPSGTEPGMFAITTSSSTCVAQGGQRFLELARVAVRDDDRRDLHASTWR